MAFVLKVWILKCFSLMLMLKFSFFVSANTKRVISPPFSTLQKRTEGKWLVEATEQVQG